MTSRTQARLWSALLCLTVLEVCVGTVAYVIAFLFAYGFEDAISTRHHVVFVILVVIIAVASWLITSPLVAARTGLPRPAARRLAGGATLSLHGAVLAAGTLSSGANEEQNSVTVGWATGTYVLVVGVAAVVALTGLVIARSAWPRVSA